MIGPENAPFWAGLRNRQPRKALIYGSVRTPGTQQRQTPLRILDHGTLRHRDNGEEITDAGPLAAGVVIGVVAAGTWPDGRGPVAGFICRSCVQGLTSGAATVRRRCLVRKCP